MPPGPHLCALVLCKQMCIVSGLQRGSCKLAGKTSAPILMELTQCRLLGLDMLMQANSICSDSERLKSDHVATTKYTLQAASKQVEIQLNGYAGEVKSLCFIKKRRGINICHLRSGQRIDAAFVHVWYYNNALVILIYTEYLLT